MELVFRRRMEYHINNTYLQTIILLGVGFLTLFFDVDNFTDRIMVTLTTMLVLATISSSIQAVRLSLSRDINNIFYCDIF